MVVERLRVYIGPRRKRKNGGCYPKWPYRYKLPGQSWMHGTGAFTEAATRQFVDGLIQDHLLNLKMIERGMPQTSDVPIQKHVADYLKWGKVEGGKGGLPWSLVHYQHRESQLRKWIDVLGVKKLSDIRYDSFAETNTARLAEGMAPNTVNHHSWALVAFLTWCQERNRISANCLSRFSSMDRRPRQERGAFTAQEFEALLAVSPLNRQLVYRVAVFTGLRRSALASLKVKSVDWLSGLVTLNWCDAKNRKTTLKPVPKRLLKDLQASCMDKDLESPLLDFSLKHAARNIHRDMRNAGITMVKDGRRRDFHSLKASLGTLLDDLGTAPEVTQRALDHASFLQTQAYIKREIGPLQTAVEDLETRMFLRRTFHTPEESRLEPLYSLGCDEGRLSPSPSNPPR